MVCVGVCLQDALDVVAPLLDDGEEGVGRLGGYGVGRGVEVEDGVDYDGLGGGRVGYDVLPCARGGLKFADDIWFACHFSTLRLIGAGWESLC